MSRFRSAVFIVFFSTCRHTRSTYTTSDDQRCQEPPCRFPGTVFFFCEKTKSALPGSCRAWGYTDVGGLPPVFAPGFAQVLPPPARVRRHRQKLRQGRRRSG